MKYLFFTIISSLLLAPSFVFAAPDYFGQIDDIGAEVYGTSTAESADLFIMIGIIVNGILGILGVVLFVIIIYAGFLWMTAGGNAEKVKTAKSWMVNAIIGIILIMASMAISKFIMDIASGKDANSVQVYNTYIEHIRIDQHLI